MNTQNYLASNTTLFSENVGFLNVALKQLLGVYAETSAMTEKNATFPWHHDSFTRMG